MARKTTSDSNVIQAAGLFAGAEGAPSGSGSITTVACYVIPQDSDSLVADKLVELENEPGTRYSTAKAARTHLKTMMRS